MTTWLLDTNAVIALVSHRSETLLRKVESTESSALAASSIVAHEFYVGAYRSQKADVNLETLRLLFTDLKILDLDREDARAAGKIGAELARRDTPIGPYDVLIAGQAMARGLSLVTTNTAEFGRIAGLRLEDWTRE